MSAATSTQGAMLYEMLTGQLPPLFASAPAQPPSAWLGSMPQEMHSRINRLVLGLLKNDRSQRLPQSAAEVVEELRALLVLLLGFLAGGVH
jgi:hypothetical protein